MPHRPIPAAALILCLAAALLVPAAACADVTASAVTSPTDGTVVIGSPTPQPFAASGTATVTAGGIQTVDLVCERFGGSTWHPDLLSGASDIPVVAGAWTAPAVTMQPTDSGGACRLRALPHGLFPADPTPFTGPRLLEHAQVPILINDGGQNAAKAKDITNTANGLTASVFMESFQSGGLVDTELMGPEPSYQGVVFADGAGVPTDGDPAAATQVPALTVDGHPAYTAPAAAKVVSPISSGYSGFPALTGTISVPGDTTATFGEHDGFARCAGADPDKFPIAGGFECSSFTPAGVQLDQISRVSNDAHVVRIQQDFSSTDGLPHDLFVAEETYVDTTGSLHGEWRFPGEAGYATRPGGTSVPIGGAPGSILAREQGAADGDLTQGLGALTFGTAPDEAIFAHSSTLFSRDLVLRYHRTVPASGMLRLVFIYSTEATAAALETDRLGAESSLNTSGPGAGGTPQTTTDPTGTATPSGGGTRTRSAVRRAVLSGRLKPKLKKGRLTSGLSVSCPGSGPVCKVTVRIMPARGKGKPVGSATFTVPAGKTVALALKLPQKTLAKLRRARLAVRLAISATRTGAPKLSATKRTTLARVRA